jgi:DNA-binding MarR family transcriptional regulator
VIESKSIASVRRSATIAEHDVRNDAGAPVRNKAKAPATVKSTRSRRAGDQDVYQSLAAFRFALRQFLAFSEATTAKAGVTAWQYQALLVVLTHADGGVTIRELADQMLMQHHGAVQLVDRLSALGLVERRRSDADRRKVIVSMTAKGAALLKRLASVHIDELLKHEPLLAETLSRLRQIGVP